MGRSDLKPSRVDDRSDLRERVVPNDPVQFESDNPWLRLQCQNPRPLVPRPQCAPRASQRRISPSLLLGCDGQGPLVRIGRLFPGACQQRGVSRRNQCRAACWAALCVGPERRSWPIQETTPPSLEFSLQPPDAHPATFRAMTHLPCRTENVKLTLGRLSVKLRVARHHSYRVSINAQHGNLFHDAFISLGVRPDTP